MSHQTAAALVRTGAMVIRALIEQYERQTGESIAGARFHLTDANGNQIIEPDFTAVANSLKQLSKNPELQFLLLPRISQID